MNQIISLKKDETYSLSSPSLVIETLSDALLDISETNGNNSHFPDAAGPWADLAGWYWDFYNEIECELSRKVSDDNIPPKFLRDQLVILYFKHVHPLCPIFDEVEFHSKYYTAGDDLAFLQSISLLEFQAMMFAASLHLNSHQIHNTNYTSTHQCHNALFEAARTTYRSCLDASPLVLTRAALLLSYWSPYASEKQSNSYWIDQVFTNARLAHLNEPQQSPDTPTSGRRRLTWWCCVTRDRLLAFGLRRIHSIHEETFDRPLPSFEDFGTETMAPKFMDKASKRSSIDTFIHLCELGQIIAGVLKFQRRRELTARNNKENSSVELGELREVVSLHAELANWRKRFGHSIGDKKTNPFSESCNMPSQLTQIFCDSVIAALYIPYTALEACSYKPELTEFSDSALYEVKGAASRIAKSLEILAYKTDSNDIPLGIGAWITFPIAAKLVFIRNSADLEDPATELQEMRTLMNVLHLLKSRFIGGEFISNVLDAVNSHIFRAAGKDEGEEGIGLLQDAAEIIDRGLSFGIIPSSKL